MRKLLVIVLLCCTVQLDAFAFQSPVTRMQNVMSGVIQSKMRARGFSNVDPRYVGTLSQVGGAIAGTAATAAVVAVAGATAPAWVTVGVAVGVGSLISSGVALGIGAAANWLFDDDGNAVVAQPDPLNVPAGPAGRVYCWYQSRVCAANPEPLCNQRAGQGGFGKMDGLTCVLYDASGAVLGPAGFFVESQSGCVGDSLSPNGGMCPPSNFPVPQPVVEPIGDALEAMPEPERIKPLNPGVIADLANDAWQRAAALPGYDGLPYDATNPITQADVEAWRSANPGAYPTVGDFLAPQPAPSTR